MPLNTTRSPATAEPEMFDTSITVGARMIILVHVWSPDKPVVPLIPSKTAVTVIGPGSLFGSVDRFVLIRPFESVYPDQVSSPSTRNLTSTLATFSPALSIIEILRFVGSPLMVLASGSKSVGSMIEIIEKPLLSKVPLLELEL